ncbi:hypothetical protein BV25DRAFT_1825154 [Artomyces pyxidatus]|uniref:Uncharacterized protein n=1 Tax=Artomyces pyxidatus TaxID=48021 RepID=A0ACB8T3G2_9AGAM|nr:hypothetical protein BV25DRAFT_1825154 [Artomyces pyxidatus]
MDITHYGRRTVMMGREPAAYRIPVEIYREIFAYIPLLEPAACMLEFSTAVSQVCRHWRCLALEMKELWTFIVVECQTGYYTQRARLALERSHPLPIVIHIEDIASKVDDYRQLVLDALIHVSRASDLFIDGSRIVEYEDFTEEVTEALESHPAPFLETFRSACFLELPGDSLFRGEVPPNLRTVEMWACYPHPLLLQAPLTHLDLSEMEMENILDLLHELPSLEVMRLETPDPSEIDTFSPPPVALPNLQTLELVGRSADSIIRFMPFLDVPCDADLILRVYGCDLDESTFNTAMQNLAAIYAGQIADARKAGLIFRDLTIAPSEPWGHDNALTLHNPTSVQATENDADDPPSLPSSMTLSMTWSYKFGDERRIVPRILSFMPAIGSHETLNVTGKRLRFLQDWLDIATYGHQVSRITANGMAAHGLIMALNQTDMPIFPRLDMICVTDLTLENQVDERPANPDYHPYRHAYLRNNSREPMIPAESLPFIKLLLEVLRSRTASGHPISHLSIQACNLSVDMISSLRALMGEEAVEWDGKDNAGPYSGRRPADCMYAD